MTAPAAHRRPILALLPQSPYDPASGAARSVLSAARLLAAAGFPVRLLATAASDAPAPPAPLDLLHALGLHPEVDRRAAVGRGCRVFRFLDRGVHITLMDTGPLGVREVDFPHGVQFSRLLRDELEQHTPEVAITLGGSPGDQDRRAMCQDAGAAVVLAVHTLGYLHPLAFDHVDAVWTGSPFLARKYRDELGLESTPLPPVIDPADVLPERRGDAVVFVNPTPGKGVYAAVTIAHHWLRARPDVPFEVVSSRGTFEQFLIAARSGGLDLESRPGLRSRPLQPRPRDLLARARVILMPSVADEPVARLAHEARAAGIPVVASDRGALADLVGLTRCPLPPAFTVDVDRPLAPDAAAPWVAAIDAACAAVSQALPDSASAHAPPALADAYAAFFAALRPLDQPLLRPPSP